MARGGIECKAVFQFLKENLEGNYLGRNLVY